MSTEEDERPIQYTTMGGAYIRCGQTRKSLEPGFYEMIAVAPGVYGIKPKDDVSDDLIDIPGTVADDIFGELELFMPAAARYRTFGLTHKRGYLLYGPPGSGKTSLARMLARRFIERAGGIVIFCGDQGSFYQGVSIMRDVEPGRPSMYLIEEADKIVDNTHCLSILDGELSIQGAVYVAMTNYKEKLKPRIANRPGRFDRVVFVDCPPEAVQIEYVRRVAARGMSPDEALDVATRIAATLRGLPMSMAHLKEAFISHSLMGVELPEVRKRFEIMAGVRNEDGSEAEFIHDDGDEPDDDDDWVDDDLDTDVPAIYHEDD